MYSRSHLKYILIILLVPVFLVSLIAADRENTVTNEEIEITSLNLNQVQNRSINDVGTENKIKIKSLIQLRVVPACDGEKEASQILLSCNPGCAPYVLNHQTGN